VAKSAQPTVQQPAVTPTTSPPPASAAGASEPASSSAATQAQAAADQPAPAPAGAAEATAAAEGLAVPPPAAVTTASLALADALASAPGGSLLEGATRIQSEMLAFGWRQTERNLATGRAMLASGSLPEVIALQAAWLGDSFENALRHGLALGRLAGDLLRAAPLSRRG
jgi:hypothetical protein